MVEIVDEIVFLQEQMATDTYLRKPTISNII